MFDLVEQKAVATIALWNLAAMLIHVIAFTILYMKGNRNQTLKTFFVAQLGMFIWLAAKVLKTVSPNVELRWAFIVIYYFGICLLEVGFVDFAVTYYYKKTMKFKYKMLLYGLGLCQFLVVLTNPYHFLFYSRYDFWGDDFGKLFYVHVVINYALILYGMILCGKGFGKQIKQATLWHRVMIPFAILAPLIFNFVYITRLLQALFKYLGIQIFDITPIVYTWSILIFIYATFKYEFFDLSPIMKHEITKYLDTLILIIDQKGEVIYTNEEFNLAFDYDGNSSNIRALIERHNLHEQIINKEAFLTYNGHYFKYVVNPLSSNRLNQYLITLEDITDYEMARVELDKETDQLKKSNEKLQTQIDMLIQTSAIGARNYVARELHDIIGHSLVVSMKLLEVSKIAYKKNKKQAEESIEKASRILEKGFSEMTTLLKRGVQETTQLKGLDKELKTMIHSVNISGISVKYYFNCDDVLVQDKVFDVLRKVSMELITNTLKHSGASQLFLSIVTMEDKIRLYVMDNGMGTETLVKGNGLSGIDSRIALVNGSVLYETKKDEGFGTKIWVPITN